MRITADRIETARTLLFVAGHRPNQFDKAAASDADLVIIDLEDVVAPQDKERARAHTTEWLERGGRAVIRINAPGTAWCGADLDTASRFRCPIMVPKARDGAVLADITDLTSGRCDLIALVETAEGIARAAEVCSAAGVVRVAFGNVDLASELGVAYDDRTALTYARSAVVVASASAGLYPPIDGVTTAINDRRALDADVVHARRLGFTGKLCIHPNQVSLVAEGFAPSESERQWARAVLDAGDSATQVNGQMVDKPQLLRARRILSLEGGGHRN